MINESPLGGSPAIFNDNQGENRPPDKCAEHMYVHMQAEVCFGRYCFGLCQPVCLFPAQTFAQNTGRVPDNLDYGQGHKVDGLWNVRTFYTVFVP